MVQKSGCNLSSKFSFDGMTKNCDKIMILENGKITNIGRHEQLLKNSVYYKQIFKSQSAKKEII